MMEDQLPGLSGVQKTGSSLPQRMIYEWDDRKVRHELKL